MMEQDDDTLTILIAQSEGGDYTATAAGLLEPVQSNRMARALVAAMDALGREPNDNLRVKVRERTRIDAKQLVALLREARDASRLVLSGCDMHEIDLSPAALDKLVGDDWPRDHITGGINLSGTQFQGANLERAQLQSARLSGTHFQAANLRHADLQGALLEGAQLQGAFLWGAQLQGAWLVSAQLQRASLGEAQLQGASLVRAQLQDAELQQVQLQGADLWGAHFEGCSLTRANLHEVDFRGVARLHPVVWENVRLEKTWLYSRQIDRIQDEEDALRGARSYRQVMETYLALKANFSSLGNYEDAAWAYIKEQQMEKASYFPTTSGKGWLIKCLGGPPPHWWTCSPRALWYRARSLLHYLRLFLGPVPPNLKEAIFVWRDRRRWARNWLYELLTGYGERPQMPLLWGLVTILIFALVFAATGNVSADFAGDAASAQGSHNFWDALTHSIAAFATIGFNTFEPIGRVARLLTAIESALGISLFALFIYTIGNRMSRS